MLRGVAIGVVAMALALAGCSGDDDDASTTTTSTGGGTSSTTTTTEEPTTTTLSREDELRRTVVELLETRTELLMNPDPARLTEWLSPNCPCWQVEYDLLNEFATNGYRLSGDDHVVVGVELTNDTGPAQDFTVIWRLPEVQVLDNSGGVVRVRPAQEDQGIGVSIARDSADGALTIHSLVNLNLTPERLAEVTDLGIP